MSNKEPEKKDRRPQSAPASALAMMLLEETLQKGETVEIPSLGITLTKENLKT